MSLLKRSIEEDIVVKFRKIGIALRPDWIEEMVSRRKISSFEKLLCLLLNDDIFHTASAGGCLPPFVEEINEGLLEGLFFLQVEEVCNVGANMENRLTDTNRMLKLFLTDGKQKIIGLEIMKIAALSCKVLPGSKLLLSHVPIRNGVFLLTPFNCKFLGGKGVPRGVAFTDLSNLLVNEIANHAARNHQTTVPLPPSTAPALSVIRPPLVSIVPNPAATDPFDLTAEISALSCDAPLSILDIDDISEDCWIDEKGSSALDIVSIYKEKMDVPIIAIEKSKRQETIIIEELFTQEDNTLPGLPQRSSISSSSLPSSSSSSSLLSSRSLSTSSVFSEKFSVVSALGKLESPLGCYTSPAHAGSSTNILTTLSDLFASASSKRGAVLRGRVFGKLESITEFKPRGDLYQVAGTFRDSSRVLKVAIASPVCEQFLGMNAQDCAFYLEGHSGRSDKAEKKRLKNSLCLRFLKFRGNCELELTCPISDVSSVPSTASTESYLCTIVLYDES